MIDTMPSQLLYGAAPSMDLYSAPAEPLVLVPNSRAANELHELTRRKPYDVLRIAAVLDGWIATAFDDRPTSLISPGALAAGDVPSNIDLMAVGIAQNRSPIPPSPPELDPPERAGVAPEFEVYGLEGVPDAPCACDPSGLTPDQIAQLTAISKKLSKKPPGVLTEGDLLVILCAIRCAVLTELNFIAYVFGFLSVLKPLLESSTSWLGIGDWIRFPGIQICIRGHITSIHESTSFGTSVDLDVEAVVLTSPGGGASTNTKTTGKARAELAPDAATEARNDDQPLKVCETRWFVGELRFDMDGSGFPEVHINGGGSISPPQGPMPK
jgi:hypothetical protein